MMNKNLISVFLFFAISFAAAAQTTGYNFYSNLDTVLRSGFYNIVLSPQINANLKTDYSDIRVIDKNDKWVPHVFHLPLQEMSREAIIEDLKYAEAESNKNNTVLIIEAAQLLHNINVNIKNTEAQKYCTLSGSNDKQKWFVITDSVLLVPQPTEKSTESNLKVNFPKSNYRYLKLVINNRNTDPYNVVAVTSNAIAQGFLFSNYSDSILPNPPTTILQKDSNRYSYVQIIQPKCFHFNQIDIKTTGVKFYNRNVELYTSENNLYGKFNSGKFIQSFTISNNSNTHIALPVLNADTFYLIVNNEDNPALKIAEVNTGLSYRYITSYLDTGQSYRIILSNKEASLPNYDITKDYPSIKDSVPFINAGNIIAFENAIVVKENKTNSKLWIIWVCVIVTLLVLLFFTKSLMRDVNKNKANDHL